MTKEHLENAMNTFIDWYPEEVYNLTNNREAIINGILNDKEPSIDIEAIIFENVKEEVGLTKCEEDCGMVAFDVVMFVFGLLGLHVSNQERMSRAIIRELGPSTLRGLARSIRKFAKADGAINKSKALFSLMGEIKSAGGFKAAFKVIKKEMSYWQWIKTGLIAVAQLGAWFLTDGAAFIAECALSVMGAEQLIEDSVKASKDC